jgi:hypothetical protein
MSITSLYSQIGQRLTDPRWPSVTLEPYIFMEMNNTIGSIQFDNLPAGTIQASVNGTGAIKGLWIPVAPVKTNGQTASVILASFQARVVTAGHCYINAWYCYNSTAVYGASMYSMAQLPTSQFTWLGAQCGMPRDAAAFLLGNGLRFVGGNSAGVWIGI